MGLKSSRLKVVAEAVLPEGSCRVDAITLSYRKASCWGPKERILARFAFPQQGWVCFNDMQMCTTQEGQRLRLKALQKKAGVTAVQIKCSSRRVVVYETCVPLTRLMEVLEESLHGGTARLVFTLSGGKHSTSFTGLTCSGWQCEDHGVEDAVSVRSEEGTLGGHADTMVHTPDPTSLDTITQAGHAVPQIYQQLPTPIDCAPVSAPQAHLRSQPSISEIYETMEEIDLGNPVSLASLNDLNGKEAEIATGLPPHNTWVDVLVDVAAVLYAACCLALLYKF